VSCWLQCPSAGAGLKWGVCRCVVRFFVAG
jgi:hypothetical protein